LSTYRRVGEDIVISGRDGISDFGADLVPFKNPRGGYASAPGVEYPSGPVFTFNALLYSGPDGPVATERYEMFREGVQLAEALIHIERAIQDKKLSPALQERAEKALEARSHAFIMNWFTIRDMPGAEEDAKLLGLAGEVAREMGREKKVNVRIIAVADLHFISDRDPAREWCRPDECSPWRGQAFASWLTRSMRLPRI